VDLIPSINSLVPFRLFVKLPSKLVSKTTGELFFTADLIEDRAWSAYWISFSERLKFFSHFSSSKFFSASNFLLKVIVMSYLFASKFLANSSKA
jgi:hypothetical protein